MTQQQKRGPGARRVKLERRLDANADVERREFGAAERTRNRLPDDDRIDAAEEPTPSQQRTGRGHRAQLAQPHRSGRPSGGNIRDKRES